MVEGRNTYTMVRWLYLGVRVCVLLLLGKSKLLKKTHIFEYIRISGCALGTSITGQINTTKHNYLYTVGR